MAIKVLIADQLSQDGIDILKSESGLSVDNKTGLTPKDLAAIVGSYEALVVAVPPKSRRK